jgi:hypothetical protein
MSGRTVCRRFHKFLEFRPLIGGEFEGFGFIGFLSLIVRTNMARKSSRVKPPPPPPTPKRPKPSDPLPWLPLGDDDPDKIHLAVGRALHTWETIESALGRIFGALILSSAEGASRAYGAIGNFSGRKDMLTAAFECYPYTDDPAVSGFPDILNVIYEFSARRNEIAHGWAKQYWDGRKSRGCYLVPPDYSSRKRISLKERANRYWALDGFSIAMQKWPPLEKYAYTAAQIDIYRASFAALEAQLPPIGDRLYEINRNPPKLPFRTYASRSSG